MHLIGDLFIKHHTSWSVCWRSAPIAIEKDQRNWAWESQSVCVCDSCSLRDLFFLYLPWPFFPPIPSRVISLADAVRMARVMRLWVPPIIIIINRIIKYTWSSTKVIARNAKKKRETLNTSPCSIAMGNVSQLLKNREGPCPEGARCGAKKY